MKTHILLTALLLTPLAVLSQDAKPLAATGQPARGGDPVDWVNPFIGTQSARWFFFTPAAAPFGLVKLAPDTTGFGGYAGGGHTTGYRFSDTTILGFSHLHDFQLGGILLMPATGPLVTVPGADGQDKSGWRSREDAVLARWDESMTQFLEPDAQGRIAFTKLPKAFGFGAFHS